MEHLSYGIPLGIAGSVLLAYALGAFSTHSKHDIIDVPIGNRIFTSHSYYGGKKKHSKTKRKH